MTGVVTAQENVLRAVRQLIAQGHLEPGQQVVQDSLAAQLGVSRVPLREALKVLEGEGQVVYFPHRGYFVADLSIDDLTEVYRIRALLEEEALSVGIALMNDEDIEHIKYLKSVVESVSESGDVAEVSAANRRFHFAMFELSNMPRLIRMIKNLWDSTDAYRSVYMANSSNVHQMILEHDEMFDALVARDIPRVVAMQAAHRENSVSAVSRVIARN
ncbi:MAG: GntR family transcriptional regulator [Actinomycetes bacterium]